MVMTGQSLEDLTLSIKEEIHVRASLGTTFAALLEELGPHHQVAEDRPLPMKLEPWPGGRWYRDLGDQNGHFWGQVQAIKRPTLLEICGPLMMSYPAFSNLQYRLSEKDGGTLIRFHHLAFGLIQEDQAGVATGWKYSQARVKARAEGR